MRASRKAGIDVIDISGMDREGIHDVEGGSYRMVEIGCIGERQVAAPRIFRNRPAIPQPAEAGRD